MEAEKTILFVDDERNILTSLRRLLRKEAWNLRFANGGEEGLEILAGQPIDLVVSDMRMPGMNGAEFLKKVKEDYPDTVRVILSGYAERDSVMEVLKEEYAQQLLTKPWKEAELKATLTRLLDQSDEQVEAGNWLKQAINGLTSLPALPSLYLRVQDLLSEDGDASIGAIASEIEQDPSISLRLLRWSNSAMFGQANRVETVHRAVVVLGTEMVQGLVLTMSVFDVMADTKVSGFDQAAFWDHCTCCGILAREIARSRVGDPKRADRIFTAGLLHDVGKLVESHYSHETFVDAIQDAAEGKTVLSDQEAKHFGTTHVEVGARLAEWWDLPVVIQQAIRWHEKPGLSDAESEAVGIVHVANALTHQFEVGASGNFKKPSVDTKVFKGLGFSEDEISDLKQTATNARLSR